MFKYITNNLIKLNYINEYHIISKKLRYFSKLSFDNELDKVINIIKKEKNQKSDIVQPFDSREERVHYIRRMVESYPAPSLASALRDREEVLYQASKIMKKNKNNIFSKKDLNILRQLLEPYSDGMISTKYKKLDLRNGFDNKNLNIIRNILRRLPRVLSPGNRDFLRASVVIPLCNVDNVPSILFERRSGHVTHHKNESCFPGGMIDKDDDTIIDTSLREMHEEIGIDPINVDVLGILRCDWSELTSITGVSVTPVVAFIGNFTHNDIFKINLDEVSKCFSVPMSKIFSQDSWIEKELGRPIFVGSDYLIWGLTAYILENFAKSFNPSTLQINDNIDEKCTIFPIKEEKIKKKKKNIKEEAHEEESSFSLESSVRALFSINKKKK